LTENGYLYRSSEQLSSSDIRGDTEEDMMNQPACSDCDVSETSVSENLSRLNEILDEYNKKPGALIPVLQHAQNLYGYLSEDVLKRISVRLDIPYSEVAGVVGFYSNFSTVPRGKYVIRVCLGTACYVRGGKQVLDALKHKLAIDIGETTPDKIFSLEVARCFGACGLAPTMSINDEVFKRVRPVKIGEIIDSYYANETAKGETL
jgi:NADH:ubiquinone oxidoreductase subunit E